MAPLIGTDQIRVPPSATLIFKHAALDPLYIHSGATAIQWAYHLNTATTPTLGGEVVQVLSALVGPMTIKGQTAGLKTNKSGRLDNAETRGWKNSGTRTAFTPNSELREIIEWFQQYMEFAGTHTPRRDERAIEFIYPERGWHFWIQATKLDGFRYDKQVISPEWSISAEIINDNALNYFSGITMSSFTDDLIVNQELIGRIGLSAFANSKTETDNQAFGQTGDRGSTNPFLNPELSPSATEAAKKMGDNFQGLVAAWSSGDFAHFGFGALLDNGALPKNVDAAYQKLFGTTLLGSLPGNTGPGTGGTSGSFTYNGNSSQDNAAVQIANAFSAAGLPPELGIAVALHESSLDPTKVIMDTNGAYSVGLFMANLKGKGAGIPGAIAASQHPSSPATQYWPTASQISTAVGWYKAGKPFGFPSNVSNLSNDQLAQWAYNVEVGEGYTTDNTVTGRCTGTFAQNISQAKQIISGFGQTGGGAASGVRLAVIQWATKLVSYYNSHGHIPTYGESGPRNMESMVVGAWPTVLDCSSSIALFYTWGTNKDRRYALNGTSFNNVNTATIWNTWQGSAIPEAAARAGDIIVFGSSAGSSYHAEMFMEDYNGDGTQVFSFGANPPTIGAFSSLKTGSAYKVFRVLP